MNVYKDILKNHSLSLRDRGMVVTLLSLPDNWEFTISGLSKIIPDGKSSIRASLTHLEGLGYISRTQERIECGKFGKIAIEIHKTPIAPLSDFRKTEKSTADNPVAGKPSSEKHAQYTNNQLNNNQVNNYSSMTASAYIRELIRTGGNIDISYPEDRAKAIRVIAGIANNINQAVKLGNSQGKLYYSDIDKLQSSLDDIKKTFGEVLEVWRLQRS